MTAPMPPEVTEVKRLTIRPGDRIIITCDTRLSEYDYDMLRSLCREFLALPDDIPLLVLPGGMDLKVAGPDGLAEALRARASRLNSSEGASDLRMELRRAGRVWGNDIGAVGAVLASLIAAEFRALADQIGDPAE